MLRPLSVVQFVHPPFFQPNPPSSNKTKELRLGLRVPTEMMLGGDDGYVLAGILNASSAEMVAGSVGSQHQQQQQQKRQKGREGVAMVKEERGAVAQWGVEETKDLIAIRADLEQHDSSTRRGSNNSKTVWEAVASRMRELGHRRTPEQCKCKWKNLINRYKGKETADPETGRQCPFFDELNAVFTERARSMQRLLLLESESGPSSSKKKGKRSNADKFSDEELSNDEDDSDSDDRQPRSKKKKKASASASASAAAVGGSHGIVGMLQEFLRQQQRMAAEWREAMERRAEERRAFEREWRERMERLERERLMLEQTAREREEERRRREESRAERRDKIMNILLNKLIQDET